MNREWAIRGILVATAVANGLPVVGVLSSEVLARLYGIEPPSGDLLILMRHRALLFGLLGALLLAAALRPELRAAAVIGGLVSMAGFVLLAGLEGRYGPELGKVVAIDAIAGLALGVAGWLQRGLEPAAA